METSKEITTNIPKDPHLKQEYAWLPVLFPYLFILLAPLLQNFSFSLLQNSFFFFAPGLFSFNSRTSTRNFFSPFPKKNFKVFLLYFFSCPFETLIYPFLHASFSTKNPFNLPQVPTWPSSFSVFFHSFPFFTFQVLMDHA